MKNDNLKFKNLSRRSGILKFCILIFIFLILSNVALADTQGQNQIFNITRGEGRQLKELVGIIQNHVGHPLKVEIIPPDFHRPERGALSIEKAKKLIGYNPKYSLEQGVQKYYQLFKQFYTNDTKT